MMRLKCFSDSAGEAPDEQTDTEPSNDFAEFTFNLR